MPPRIMCISEQVSQRSMQLPQITHPNVQVSLNQDPNTYDPPGLLDIRPDLLLACR